MATSDDVLKGWITVSDAAEIIGVTPRRVQQMILERSIRAIEVNPRLKLVDESDVKRVARTPRKPGRKPQ